MGSTIVSLILLFLSIRRNMWQAAIAPNRSIQSKRQDLTPFFPDPVLSQKTRPDHVLSKAISQCFLADI